MSPEPTESPTVEDLGRGAVVVTGASTGIGRATALHLDTLGFLVFAGIRRDVDGDALNEEASARLRPLHLDITDAGSIREAAASVAEVTGSRGLAGLVNNAGVAIAAPLEFVPIDELRRQLEVNVIGQVAVTQALLPLLRTGRGRVVNIGSIGGRVALPLLGPYAASKFAMEALTDSLRREVKRWGIEVAIVEPGGIATPIWEKSSANAAAVRESWPPEVEPLYGELIAAVQGEADKIATRGLPPKKVAEVVEHALTASRPRTRYLVGRDAKLRAAVARVLPDRAFDSLIGRALSRPQALTGR